MIPVPNYIQECLKNPKSNFSLMFPRLVDWNEKGEFKKNENAIERISGFSKEHLSGTGDFLKSIHARQSEYVKALDGKEIKAKLVSPFITGLGAGHPTETGMILDRNTGVPYIPASSIKGVLKTAYAVNIANENGIADDAEIEKVFGKQNEKSPDQKGRIVILDAYPENPPKIQNDIMNPHFTEYYNAKENDSKHKLPLENENPVPIKFLSVQKGCVFVFRYIVTDENFVKAEYIEKAFDTAFKVVGFGGKTSIGYGRFERVGGAEEKLSGNPNANFTATDVDSMLSSLKPIPNKQYEKGEAIVTEVKDGFIIKVKARISIKGRVENCEISTTKTKGNLYEKIRIEIRDTNKISPPKMATRI